MDKMTFGATLKQELEIVLETALMLAPDTSIPALAERIYDSEPDLIEKIQRPWIVDRLKWMLHRKQAEVISAEKEKNG